MKNNNMRKIYNSYESDKTWEILYGVLFSETIWTIVDRTADEMEWMSDNVSLTVYWKWDVKPGRMNQRTDDVKVQTDFSGNDCWKRWILNMGWNWDA